MLWRSGETFEEFIGGRKMASLFLRKYFCAVNGDLKDTSGAGDQFDLGVEFLL